MSWLVFLLPQPQRRCAACPLCGSTVQCEKGEARPGVVRTPGGTVRHMSSTGLGVRHSQGGGLVFSQLAQCCSCDRFSLSSSLLICKRVNTVHGPQSSIVAKKVVTYVTSINKCQTQFNPLFILLKYTAQGLKANQNHHQKKQQKSPKPVLVCISQRFLSGDNSSWKSCFSPTHKK